MRPDLYHDGRILGLVYVHNLVGVHAGKLFTRPSDIIAAVALQLWHFTICDKLRMRNHGQ